MSSNTINMNAGEDIIADVAIADGIAEDTMGADPTPLTPQTSQLFHSFSLLEPAEHTYAQTPTAPSSDLPPTHVQTSSFSSNFQPQSPAGSPFPAMLLDLQSHDRRSRGQESHDQSQLPHAVAMLDNQQWSSQQGEVAPGGLHEGRSQASSAVQLQTQTDCSALDALAAHAAASLPQQLEEHEMGLPQLSSGSHSQLGMGFLQPSSDGHSQDTAAVEELPFALSSGSSSGQWRSHPSSSSCSSYSSMHLEADRSMLVSMVQPNAEEVVHLPSEKNPPTSEERSATEAVIQLIHSRDHLSSSHMVVESSTLPFTAAADKPQLPAVSPQLWAADTAEATPDLVAGIDGSPHPPVSVVAEALQQRATATAQPPPLPPPSPLPLTSDLPLLSSDLPQLTVATVLMPGSPTGALLPGTGIGHLDRPGSSPLPVSKMLRMVSEDQASLLSNLAAQCAAPGGLLGRGPTGEVQDLTGTVGAAPTLHACSPSIQAVPASMGNQSSSAQQAQRSQHAQRSLRRHTSPTLECTAASSHQVSAASSAPGPTGDESYLQSAHTHRSPLRKRLSQFFSPIFGSVSPHSTHVQQSPLQQPLLQSVRQAQAQQLQQQLPEELLVTGQVQHGAPAQLLNMREGDAAVSEPVAWQLPSPHQPAAALLSTGPSAVFSHGGLLSLYFPVFSAVFTCCLYLLYLAQRYNPCQRSVDVAIMFALQAVCFGYSCLTCGLCCVTSYMLSLQSNRASAKHADGP